MQFLDECIGIPDAPFDGEDFGGLLFLLDNGFDLVRVGDTGGGGGGDRVPRWLIQRFGPSQGCFRFFLGVHTYRVAMSGCLRFRFWSRLGRTARCRGWSVAWLSTTIGSSLAPGFHIQAIRNDFGVNGG